MRIDAQVFNWILPIPCIATIAMHGCTGGGSGTDGTQAGDIIVMRTAESPLTRNEWLITFYGTIRGQTQTSYPQEHPIFYAVIVSEEQFDGVSEGNLSGLWTYTYSLGWPDPSTKTTSYVTLTLDGRDKTVMFSNAGFSLDEGCLFIIDVDPQTGHHDVMQVQAGTECETCRLTQRAKEMIETLQCDGF